MAEEGDGNKRRDPLVHCRITSEPLDLLKLSSVVASPEAGAISSFVGVTRNNFQGWKVVRLEYEAYEAMALRAMKDIGKACHLRHHGELTAVAMAHRIGLVPVGNERRGCN